MLTAVKSDIHGATCRHSHVYVYIIAWSAVVLEIDSTSNVGSNFHEVKPSEISCITSAIHP